MLHFEISLGGLHFPPSREKIVDQYVTNYAPCLCYVPLKTKCENFECKIFQKQFKREPLCLVLGLKIDHLIFQNFVSNLDKITKF